MKHRKNIIATIACMLLFTASTMVIAQTGNDYVNTAELYEGRADIVAGVRIALEPGFHATTGSMVHVYIGTNNLPPSNEYSPESGNLVHIEDNPSANRNFIKTTYLREATSQESQIIKKQKIVEIEYLNAFGNLEMTILVKGTPNHRDLVSNILKYGIGGRVDSQYLPCEVEDDDGKYQTDVFETVYNYYNEDMLEGRDGDEWPYKQYLYDGSPLNRSAGFINEGYQWLDHPTQVKYKCNPTSIAHWKANANGAFVSISYPTGSLRMEEHTDEDGQMNRVYYDNLGRQVRIEAVAPDGAILRTAYIYDDLGRLRCVMSPKASSPSEIGLCYYYTYDSKGRIVEKNIPDHGTERCVYDKRNRMVMSQDGNLLAKGEWAFSLYDVFGRVVASGYLSNTMDKTQLQDLFDAQSVVDEQWAENGALYGYSGVSFPAALGITANDIQNVNWYDQYDFLNLFQQDYSCPDHPSGEPIIFDTQTKGLPTGSMEKANLLTEDMEILHVNYYDNKCHLLCSVNDNHLEGRTNRFFKYDFNGEVTEESVSHTVSGQEPLLIRSRYTYDHVGRKLQEMYRVNNDPEFVAKAYEYNAIGDLLNTYLYSPNDGNTFAQKLKYHYNIRGWLKRVNDFEDPGFDLFALRLAYERPSSNLTANARYNGNISQMCSNGRYTTPHGFGFSYDEYGRLSGCQYGEGTTFQQNPDAYTEDYGYDANGNLLYLWRVYEGSYIDELDYKYYQGTNRIEAIADNAGNTSGYNANIHPYNYDQNGNPTYDPSRHASIVYNRLNKPVSVGFSPSDKIKYSYSSTGTKLRKEVEATATPQNLVTDYCGEFMYEDGDLVCIFAPFGRIRPMATEQGTRWRTYYSLTDHLGNVRAEFVAHDSGQPELMQQTDYYPFGYTLRRNDFGSQHPNRRLFGGKELQDETIAGNTLDWYDFEARMYDPLIGRFMTTDAKEEKYYNVSPYVYCLNNPMVIIDPTGDTVRYADNPRETKEIVENLLSKTNEDGSKNPNYSRGFAKIWNKLNKSKTVYTFRLNNDIKSELGKEENGVVRFNPNGNGYLIEFSQDKGVRVTGVYGGFSSKYAALFEESYHAHDIDKGKFRLGEQTVMDEARAWKFAATAPGTIDFLISPYTEEGMYSAAYTVKNKSTRWVAKMLKEGCNKSPLFLMLDSEGKEHYVQGETIERAYPALEKGRGYGKCFVSFKIHIPIDTYNLDTSNVAPEQLAYNCKGQLVLKFNKKKTYSGTVSGDIVCPYVVHPERVKKFPKSYIRFYNRFASCHYLFGIAASLEKDMSQFVYSHVFVNGFIDYGKETGEWQFRYTYEDTDFLFMTANYKNGKLEGTVKFYKPDGRLYQEAEFEKGKLVLRIWYNEEGEIIYKDYYKNDKLIRTEQYAKDPRSF